MQSNTSNYFKNSAAWVLQINASLFDRCSHMFSLSMLMGYESVPGTSLNTHKKSWVHRMLDSFKRFQTHSTQPDALMAPFRQIALEMYEQLNKNVAR